MTNLFKSILIKENHHFQMNIIKIYINLTIFSIIMKEFLKHFLKKNIKKFKFLNNDSF